MCFIRNFGLSNNVGDLTAKSDAQGAAAMVFAFIYWSLLYCIKPHPLTLECRLQAGYRESPSFPYHILRSSCSLATLP